MKFASRTYIKDKHHFPRCHYGMDSNFYYIICIETLFNCLTYFVITKGRIVDFMKVFVVVVKAVSQDFILVRLVVCNDCFIKYQRK